MDILKADGKRHRLFCFSHKKRSGKKRTSHKEVWIFLVGTGVLDGPKKHNCYAEDKDYPRQIFRSVGVILCDPVRQIGICLISRADNHMYLF